jgi:putative hydrolase of the HAD superfamily
MTPQAIIFDLDDTLIQTHLASASTWRQLTDEFSKELSIAPERFDPAVEAARRYLWVDPARHAAWRQRMAEAPAEILRIAAGELAIELPEHTPRRFADRYVRLFFRALLVFPQAHELLEALRARGIRLAMITNGEAGWQRRKLAHAQLDHYFETILVEGEFGVGKPDPSTYRHVLDALRLPPEQVWMVGDRLDWDVLAPQRLGITGVWFDYQHKGLPDNLPERPRHVIRGLDDIGAQF